MTTKDKHILQCLLYIRRHIGQKVTHKQIKDTFGTVQIKMTFSHLYNMGYLEKVDSGLYLVKNSCDTNLEELLVKVKMYESSRVKKRELV